MAYSPTTVKKSKQVLPKGGAKGGRSAALGKTMPARTKSAALNKVC